MVAAMKANEIRQSLRPFAAVGGKVDAIEVRLQIAEGNRLYISYLATGDIARLLIPSPSLPHRGDRLWEHTCFEVFLGVVGSPAYYEFNFSPSGEWAAFSFRAYRDGVAIDDDELAPNIRIHCESGQLKLEATIQLSRLPTIILGTVLRVELSAVLESNDGTLSYWAIDHLADKPDFHHPDSFALALALPAASA